MGFCPKGDSLVNPVVKYVLLVGTFLHWVRTRCFFLFLFLLVRLVGSAYFYLVTIKSVAECSWSYRKGFGRQDMKKNRKMSLIHL